MEERYQWRRGSDGEERSESLEPCLHCSSTQSYITQKHIHISRSLAHSKAQACPLTIMTFLHICKSQPNFSAALPAAVAAAA